MTSSPYPQAWLASGLLLGSAMTLFVLMQVPQPQADTLTYLALAAGLILAIASLLTFAGIQLRRAWYKGRLEITHYHSATRQGLEVAVLIVGGLLLWGFNGVSWWEAGLLAAAVVFAEIAWNTRKNLFTRS